MKKLCREDIKDIKCSTCRGRAEHFEDWEIKGFEVYSKFLLEKNINIFHEGETCPDFTYIFTNHKHKTPCSECSKRGEQYSYDSGIKANSYQDFDNNNCKRCEKRKEEANQRGNSSNFPNNPTRVQEVKDGWWNCRVCNKDLQGGKFSFVEQDYQKKRIKHCINHSLKENEIEQLLEKHCPDLCPLNCSQCGEKYQWEISRSVGSQWDGSASSDGINSAKKLPCACENSPFIRGKCSECSISNTWIDKSQNNICFDCDWKRKKLGMELTISNSSLVEVKLNWHNLRQSREKIIRQNPHVKRELENFFDKVNNLLGIDNRERERESKFTTTNY